MSDTDDEPREYECYMGGCDFTFSFSEEYYGLPIHPGYYQHLMNDHPELTLGSGEKR